MERYLLFASALVGIVGGLCGWLLPAATARGEQRAAGDATPDTRRAGRGPTSGALFWIAAGLPFLVFLATLPTRAPFSAGQGWGRGFFLGGLCAFLAGQALLAARRHDHSPAGTTASDAALLAAVPCSLVVAAVAGALLFLGGGGIVDALAGLGMGWLAVTLTLLAGQNGREPDGNDGARAITLALGAGFAVTLCAVAALGVFRGAITATPDLSKGVWSALAVTFAAGVPFALLLDALTARLSGGASVTPLAVRFAAASLLLAGLGTLLGFKVAGDTKLIAVAFGGLVAGPLAWWLVRDAAAAAATNDDFPAATLPVVGLPPLALLLVAAGFLVAYQLLQGFGVGVFLLAMWLAPAVLAASGPASPARSRAAAAVETSAITARLVGLLLLGVVLLVYRLFASRWSDLLRGTSLTDHYAFFGFLVGASVPGVIAGMLSPAALTPVPSPNGSGFAGGRGVPEAKAASASRQAADELVSGTPLPPAKPEPLGEGTGVRAGAFPLLLAAALVLATPAVLLVLFGPRCALALLAGLALGSVPAFVIRRGGQVAAGATSLVLPGLLAVSMALALAQFAGPVVPLGDLTRAGKVRIVGGVVAGVAVLLAATTFGDRARRPGGGIGDPAERLAGEGAGR